MRVLSFIPALLLAAAGFVAAAPTSPSTSPATTAVDSCAPSADDFNNAPVEVKSIIAIITGVTGQIEPLNTQLGGYTTNPNANDVHDVVIKVTVILQKAIVDIRAALKVDLTVLNLWVVVPAVFNFLTAVTFFLANLVIIVKALGVSVAGTLLTAIRDLLVAVGAFFVELRVMDVGAVQVVLGSVFAVVIAQVNLLSAILGLGLVVAV